MSNVLCLSIFCLDYSFLGNFLGSSYTDRNFENFFILILVFPKFREHLDTFTTLVCYSWVKLEDFAYQQWVDSNLTKTTVKHTSLF
jgi:hypothetical protein